MLKRGLGTVVVVLGYLAFFLASAAHTHELPGLAPSGPSIHASVDSASAAGDCLACRLSHERVLLAKSDCAVHGLDRVRAPRVSVVLPPIERRDCAPRSPRAPPTLPTA